MKKTISIAAIVIALVTTAQVNAQNKSFNVKVFQKELIKEMAIQFPGFKLDTTLNYILRAENVYAKNTDGTYKLGQDGKRIVLKDAQDVAIEQNGGNPVSFTFRDKGNVNVQNNEKKEAKRVVEAFKQKMTEKLISDDFVEFAALAINKNGTILYALILDNNFTRESLEVNPEEIENNFRGVGLQVIEQ